MKKKPDVTPLLTLADLRRYAPVLRRRAEVELTRSRDECLRLAGTQREHQADAARAGEADIARTLGLLAAQFELRAQLAEAQLRPIVAARGRASSAARAPRKTARRSPLKRAVQQAMKGPKRAGSTFSDFLCHCLLEGRIGRLVFAQNRRGMFCVSDEYTGATQDYTRASLQVLFSTSDKPND